jgi:acetate kinase
MVKVDLLIFTGGIGENGVNMRNRICNRLENIGIHISPELNQEVGSQPGVISKAYSPVTILVIPTNEELQIAMDTHELVSVS